SSPGRARQLQVPLAMVRGRHSKVVLPHHTRLIRAMPRGEFMSLPGGHMFPLERPRETAELLKGVFDRWSRATEERSA
ncbi:alpha/beta hydrolase, partial [Pseudomonas aeruginosa]|nr:alpha/beta hydrolase [Pseudomonas aeruginosa]